MITIRENNCAASSLTSTQGIIEESAIGSSIACEIQREIEAAMPELVKLHTRRMNNFINEEPARTPSDEDK